MFSRLTYVIVVVYWCINFDTAPRLAEVCRAGAAAAAAAADDDDDDDDAQWSARVAGGNIKG